MLSEYNGISDEAKVQNAINERNPASRLDHDMVPRYVSCVEEHLPKVHEP